MSDLKENIKPVAETQLQVAIAVLLRALSDKNPSVREAVTNSLTKLSDKYPNQVLISCSAFCKESKEPQVEHMQLILELMNKICSDYLVNIDEATVNKTIEFSFKMMTEKGTYEPAIQIAASDVLVALGRVYHLQVAETLLQNLHQGLVPHYTILHTLGALASIKPLEMTAHFETVLSIVLPLLDELKADYLKQAFAFAIRNFCEGLEEFSTDQGLVSESSMITENLKTELGRVYDNMFSVWLISRDPKVVETVLEMISALFLLLSTEKVCQQISKVILFLFTLYKKNISQYVITKCLHAILTKSASVNGMLLEPLVPNILNNLSDLLCLNPDYAQPESVRCHSEVLRCYECLAIHFTDLTIDRILGYLRNNNDKDKLKGLIVVTHLIAYSAEQTIHRRINDILKHIRDLLAGAHTRTKKALVKTISALAHKKILMNRDLNPDGPDIFLEFLLKMCCKQQLPKGSDISSDDLQDIRMSADNAIYMLTISVPELSDVLWQLLMKCFLDINYDNAIIILLRCLTYLASKKLSVFNREVSFVRALILLSNPLPSLRGTYILNFVGYVTPWDQESSRKACDGKLAHLLTYLNQNFDAFNVAEWQDQLFNFVNLLLNNNVTGKDFTELILCNAQVQLGLYNDKRIFYDPNRDDVQSRVEEKKFLLKLTAIILTNINSKESVLQTLDSLLINVRLTDYSELRACAVAVGITSRVHLQLVLDKLGQIRKEVSAKKAPKLFSFMKSQSQELEIERLKYAIICSYGEVCNEAPCDKLLRVIESEMLDFLLTELSKSTEFVLKRACLEAIQNMAKAYHPNYNKLHIKMSKKDTVIDSVLHQMHLHNGPDYIELFPLIISTITALLKIPLPLESAESIRIMKLFFDNVYNASAIYCKINPSSPDGYYGDLKLVPSITKSYSALNQFVNELLLQNISPSTLDEIETHLDVWFSKKKPEQRLPAIETLRVVLQNYLDHMRFAYDLPSTFGQTGSLLARIVPRCTDPNKNIRKVAVDCVCIVLCIAGRYEGHMRDHDEAIFNNAENIRKNIDSENSKVLFSLASDVARLICSNLPQFQLVHFIDGLIESLLDCENSSSYGTSIILDVTLKSKGTQIQSHVASITGKLVSQLDKIHCSSTKSTTLKALLSLARQHSGIIGGVLLTKPLPFESSICDCWSILSTDHTVSQDLLDQIKKQVKNTNLYELQGESEKKVASLSSLQALSALHELLKNPDLKEICLNQFPELFCLLLICLASYIGCYAPEIKSQGEKSKYGFGKNSVSKLIPVKVAFGTFRSFLLCCSLNNMASNLLSYNGLETTEDIIIFLEVVETLVNDICSDMTRSLREIIIQLGPFIRSSLEQQRVAVVAFFTSMLKRGLHEEETVLIENILEAILDVQLDQSYLVRKIGLEGLGYASESLEKHLLSAYSNQIIDVLMNTLDFHNIGNESGIILESLKAFSKLLSALPGYKFHNFQITAAVRLKLLFGQEDCQLRRASIQLLGDLASSLYSEMNLESFREQIQGNLITLLLHLCDPDIYVAKACKYTLRKVGPLLQCPDVNNMIQQHLIDEANLHYTDFIRDFIKVMAREMQDLFHLFIMTSITYLKSPWIQIKSNGALVTGLLYSELSAENKPKVSLDTICDKLIRLMQDDSEEVRIKASQAISYMFIS